MTMFERHSMWLDSATGDLDAKAAAEILELMHRLNVEFEKTIVMVTHDPNAAARARTTVHLEKGLLVSQLHSPHVLEAGR